MAAKFPNRIPLNVDDAMYASLLHEAGSERNIPALIRQKIEDSYHSKSDIKKILAQLDFCMNVLRELHSGHATSILNARLTLESLPKEKQTEAMKDLKQIKSERLEKLMLFAKDADI